MTKSFDFGVIASKVAMQIRKEHKEFDLSRQLLRASTSVGANAEEAMGGQSSRDFYHKLTIAYKEARESHYFIRILFALKLVDQPTKDELISKAEELLRIIGSIQTTMRKKQGIKFGKH